VGFAHAARSTPAPTGKEWSDILDVAEIEHAGTHGTRHSAAAIAIDQGVRLSVVQEIMPPPWAGRPGEQVNYYLRDYS
jgi:hypothetical protein